MKISIVIPYHNREKRIKATLMSVLSQSHRPLELIVVNNNSSDKSESICREFKEKYESDDLEIILTEEQKIGANAARNKGLELATSEYISFFDSDDLMLPNRMELINNAIVNNSLADIIGTISNVTDESSGKDYVKMRSYSSDTITQIVRGQLYTCSMTIRVSALKSINGWDERLDRWQDWNLGVRLLLKGYKVKWIEGVPLDTVYVHNDSITGRLYGTKGNPLLKSILITLDSIENESNRDISKLRGAIIYRLYLLSALIEREGNLTMSKETLDKAKELSKGLRLLGAIFNLLNRYTYFGGRGAWRAAYLSIQLFG